MFMCQLSREENYIPQSPQNFPASESLSLKKPTSIVVSKICASESQKPVLETWAVSAKVNFMTSRKLLFLSKPPCLLL